MVGEVRMFLSDVKYQELSNLNIHTRLLKFSSHEFNVVIIVVVGYFITT